MGINSYSQGIQCPRWMQGQIELCIHFFKGKTKNNLLKIRLYTWASPDGQHRNQIDYILCSQRWRSSKQSEKQDRELTVAQIMNSLLPNSDLN